MVADMPQGSPAERILRELRVRLFESNISQTALARKVGVSPSGVSRRFAGEVPVTVDELDRFARAAGYHLDICLTPNAAPASDAGSGPDEELGTGSSSSPNTGTGVAPAPVPVSPTVGG